jgi:hypothetical protein
VPPSNFRTSGGNAIGKAEEAATASATRRSGAGGTPSFEEIQRLEVEARPATTDLGATLKASLERKGPAKAPATKSKQEAMPVKRPARRRAS